MGVKRSPVCNNSYPTTGVGKRFRTTDRFQPGVILRTGPKKIMNLRHMQIYYNS